MVGPSGRESSSSGMRPSARPRSRRSLSASNSAVKPTPRFIFFETPRTLEAFKEGQFALAAQASAVAVTAGASADVRYRDGVAVFTLAKGGLMYEASVGGQKFEYQPFNKGE